jgi:hypothetical protein
MNMVEVGKGGDSRKMKVNMMMKEVIEMRIRVRSIGKGLEWK